MRRIDTTLIPSVEVRYRTLGEMLDLLGGYEKYPDLGAWFRRGGFAIPGPNTLLLSVGVSADMESPHLDYVLGLWAYNEVADAIFFIWDEPKTPRWNELLGTTSFDSVEYLIGIGEGSCLLELMRKMGLFKR